MKKRIKIFASCAGFLLLLGQEVAKAEDAGQNDQTTKLNEVEVVGNLDQARNQIVPSLGATKYEISPTQINTQSQGGNAPFNEVLLRAPGVAQDSFGQLHVRGEHANLQYRINDVLLPEGLSGFGQELNTRFIDSVSLMTGALPAQFGYRTAGIVDVHTKSGVFSKGGDVSMYGGSFNTIRPSLEYGGSKGAFNYYFTGDYLQDDLGIENPTNSYDAIHDHTQQYRGFGYMSYILDDTSRLNFIVSSSGGWFQIPNNPGQPTSFTLTGTPTFDSAALDENQRELNDYGIVAYQKSVGNFDMQASVFSRYSSIRFDPDEIGDLLFNGVASHVNRRIFSNGLEFDSSYHLGEKHTLRAGTLFTAERALVDTTTAVFPVDGDGNQTSSDPLSVADNSSKWGFLYGFYVQDEWKVAKPLTINFGGRFDGVSEFVNEFQFSPRLNIAYTPTTKTTIHGGYARYFTPPPLELVNTQSVQKFDGTTNASEVTQSSPVKSERAHYFDAGITQEVLPGFQLGLDGYYKIAKNQLDEGQFGQALVFSPFNYHTGRVYGVEGTATFKRGGFSTYGNFAYSHATGKKIVSGEFQFGQDELDFIAANDVFLDHDQRFTGSFGASYAFKFGTTLFTDLLVGSGLRKGFANTEHLPVYSPWNVGVQQDIKLRKVGVLQARFDIVNLLDQVYELRDGSGIGVGAPQFGQRRSFFGGLTLAFGGSQSPDPTPPPSQEPSKAKGEKND